MWKAIERTFFQIKLRHFKKLPGLQELIPERFVYLSSLSLQGNVGAGKLFFQLVSLQGQLLS